MEKFVAVLKAAPSWVLIFIGCFLFYFLAKTFGHKN